MTASMRRVERGQVSVPPRVVIEVEPTSYHFGEACRSAQPIIRRARSLAARFLEQYTTLAPPDPAVDRPLGSRIDLRV